ncbi:hypothetical protein D3C73_871410 [compost metagenome]
MSALPTSTVVRVRPQLPTFTDTLPVSSALSACLRIRFTDADGLPAPLSRPVAPRTTSTRSYRARSRPESP